MFERFTGDARTVVVLAQDEARRLGHHYVGSEHLLLALWRKGGPVVERVLADTLVKLEQVEAAIVAAFRLDDSAPRPTSLPFSGTAKRVLDQALREALSMGHNHIGAEHLLLGITRDPNSLASIVLGGLGVDSSRLRSSAMQHLAEAEAASTGPAPAAAGRSRAARPASVLEAFSRNLTAEAARGDLDPVVGRQREIDRILQILVRRTKTNPVLVGDPGVGKTALVEGLAARVAAGQVPAKLAGIQIHSVDMGALVAGTRFRGDFEERIKALIDEAKERPEVVLFLDEIHTLVGTGAGEGTLDAAQMLKPALARGEIRLIGATTTDEYRHIEQDPALERRFAPVQVEEPTVTQTIAVLRGLREHYETHHELTITDDALEAAARLSARYLPERRLPDKAFDLLDEAAARVRLVLDAGAEGLQRLVTHLSETDALRNVATVDGDTREAERLATELRAIQQDVVAVRRTLDGNGSVAAGDVAAALATWTGIPAETLTGAEAARLVGMEEVLARRLVGQQHATAAVSAAVRRSRSGMGDPNRPVGSFLFLGPTGVGKTELARALAEFLFGDVSAMVRIDMSEYMEAHTVSRLVGAPPGYVGHDAGGQLTEAVRRRPYRLVLLDEVEKAHPEVFNTLLQVLDDGRLTDGQGRTVDFTNTVIVMTSNLGSDQLNRRTTGFTGGQLPVDHNRVVALDAVKKAFRPEFVNRIDEVIVFDPLDPAAVEAIATKFAQQVIQRAATRGLQLSFAPEALAHLARAGFDPELGARPLRRVFQRQVEDPLAEGILLGHFGPGDTAVVETDLDVETGRSSIVIRHRQGNPLVDLMTN